MILHIVYPLATLAAGFGLGRVKNASKLAAIKTYLMTAETTISTDVKTVIADIKAKL